MMSLCPACAGMRCAGAVLAKWSSLQSGAPSAPDASHIQWPDMSYPQPQVYCNQSGKAYSNWDQGGWHCCLRSLSTLDIVTQTK